MQFVPAASPVSAFWSPGSFRYEVQVSAAEATDRIRAATVAFDALGRDKRRAEFVSWIQPGRIRLWRQSLWRRRPLSGALLFDGLVDEQDSTTIVSGRLRMAPAYIATVAWTLLYLAIAAVLRMPWQFALLLPAAALTQVAFIAVAAQRDAPSLLEFVEQVLEHPGEDAG